MPCRRCAHAGMMHMTHRSRELDELRRRRSENGVCRQQCAPGSSWNNELVQCAFRLALCICPCVTKPCVPSVHPRCARCGPRLCAYRPVDAISRLPQRQKHAGVPFAPGMHFVFLLSTHADNAITRRPTFSVQKTAAKKVTKIASSTVLSYIASTSAASIFRPHLAGRQHAQKHGFQ